MRAATSAPASAIGQRHVGGARQRRPDALPESDGSAGVLVAVGGQDVSVCGRVLLRERGDATPQAVGPFGQSGRVDEVVGGRTGGHAG